MERMKVTECSEATAEYTTGNELGKGMVITLLQNQENLSIKHLSLPLHAKGLFKENRRGSFVACNEADRTGHCTTCKQAYIYISFTCGVYRRGNSPETQR